MTRLRLLSADLDPVRGHIDALLQQMPQAVRGMSVVVDSEVATDLNALLAMLRDAGMQVLAVSEGPLATAARAAGLPVVPAPAADGAAEAAPERPERPERPAPERAVAPAAAPPPAAATRIITTPVRSGQQIYAERGDLVVLTSVSPGAEVIADGSVHVYGRLSGRAIAGARGDERARVFCRRMEAELIAVAGIYAVAEQIREAPRGAPAQARLENGRLLIEPMPD